METRLTVSFRVPKKAYELLKMINEQNNVVWFELDEEKRRVIIKSDLLDFPSYSDDWNTEDFEDSEYWDGVE